MKRLWGWFLMVVGIFLFFVFLWTRGGIAKPQVDNPPEELRLHIAYMAGHEGYIFSKPLNDLGGLMRCASILGKLRTVHGALLLANGNQTDRIDGMASTLHACFLNALRFDAINVGPGTLKVKVSAQVPLADTLSFLSSNLLHQGKPAFLTKRIREVTLSDRVLKIAIVGVTAAAFEPVAKSYSANIVVADIEKALTQTLNELPSDISLTVLLAHVTDENMAFQLAEQIEGIDLILFEASGVSPMSEPRTVNHTLIANAGPGVSHIRHFRLILNPDGKGIQSFTSTLIPLSVNIPDAPAFFELIEGYREVFMSEESELNKKKKHLIDAYPNTYVGSEMCARCHAYAYHVWKRTKHATPFEAEGRGCLDCHGTGYGFEMEATVKQDISDNVGCEACHGPGKQHSMQPEAAVYKPLPVTVCDSCHTHSQSPTFSYSTYWQQINH